MMTKTMNRPFQTAALAVSAALSLATVPALSLASDAQPLPKAPPPNSDNIKAEGSVTTDDRFQRDAAPAFDTELLSKLRPATALLGTRVKDGHGRKVGKLRDLVLDLPSGEVIAALVKSRSGGQVVLVPAQVFRAADKDEVVLNTDRETFDSAPCLPGGRPANALDGNSLAEAFRHFQQKAPELPGPSSGTFCSAAGLLGVALLGQGEAPLGQLKDLVVILPQSRLVYLVIKPATGPNTNTVLFVVPPTSLKAEAAGRVLRLNASQAHFLAGPHFPKGFWAELVRPELAAAVQQHYGLELATAATAEPTRQQVRARMGPPAVQGGARQSDEEMSQAIMAEILRQVRPSTLKDLRITILNGHVTLNGRLRSARLRRRVLSAAQLIAGASNVDNQLQ